MRALDDLFRDRHTTDWTHSVRLMTLDFTNFFNLIQDGNIIINYSFFMKSLYFVSCNARENDQKFYLKKI